MTFKSLPFVRVDEQGNITSTWAVDSTIDYAAGCTLGRSYFEALYEIMQSTMNPTLFHRVVQGQMSAGPANWGAIEIAFHQAAAEKLLK